MAIAPPANRLRIFLLLAAVLAVGGTAGRAQNTGHPTASPQMLQLQQALSLAQHGDRQGAMNLVLQLLEQRPDFAPARRTERFKALMRKNGLVDYWRANGWPDLCHPTTGDDFICD